MTNEQLPIAFFLLLFILNIVLFVWIYSIKSNSKKIKKLLYTIAFLEIKKMNKSGDDLKFEEIYKKGALCEEIDTFLKEYNFARVHTVMTPHGWGDGLYIKF